MHIQRENGQLNGKATNVTGDKVGKGYSNKLTLNIFCNYQPAING